MAILIFTLAPEAIGKLHDALVCLGKFSEAVSIQASHDKLILTALNSSKSAYCSFTLIGNKFFAKYVYSPVRSSNSTEEKFNCKIYNKALLSIFKGRTFDPTREKNTAVEKCDVTVEDGEGKANSRFIIKMACRHGVLKTYRLTFESVPPVHALFVKESANNCWSISSKALREFVEHFGPGTELLEIFSEDGRVSFTTFTEKLVSGNEILKQPLHTTIAVDTLEFGEFSVEEKLRIIINVKDFKAVIAHASITNTMVKALYSRPSNPMEITYGDGGIFSEFIFMTIGESRGASATPAPASRTGSKRPASRPPLEATSEPKRTATSMAPPPTSAAPSISREASKPKVPRPSPPPQQSSFQSQALFLPPGDGDEKWDPVNFDEGDDDEMLLWDISGSKNAAQTTESMRHSNAEQAGPPAEASTQAPGSTDRLPPTQRVSEVWKLFDD